jgi:hypothetical protein
MKADTTAKSISKSIKVAPYAYAFYLLLVIYLLIKGDYDSAATNFTLALIFDPFDASVRWQERPLYQRIWLLCHLLLALAGLLYMFIH